jgi:hypothetical protein
VAGTSEPKLKNVKALAGIGRRDYSYEVFWVTFPLLEDGKPVLPDSVREAELVVSIHDKEGKLSWPVPDSIRQKSKSLTEPR